MSNAQEINNAQEIIEKIFAHIENGDIDKAVYACLRLSRKQGDIFNTIIFLRELFPDRNQFNYAFVDETIKLNEETRNDLWKKTFDHWLEERTVDANLINNLEESVIAMGVGDIQKEITLIKERIKDLEIPQGMGEYDTAAFADRYVGIIAKFRLKISLISTIQERIRVRCFNYASRIEKQLDSKRMTNNFLSNVQDIVNSYFASRSNDTYVKLQKAASLIESENIEDSALLLTSIRRAINAVADYFYPVPENDVKCVDGKIRKMGKDQYLNRLYEFCCVKFQSSTSNDLIQAELDYLMVFAKKLNAIASKGVHAKVTNSEAKQGFVGLYLFLFNIISKLERIDPS